MIESEIGYCGFEQMSVEGTRHLDEQTKQNMSNVAFFISVAHGNIRELFKKKRPIGQFQLSALFSGAGGRSQWRPAVKTFSCAQQF